MNNRCLLRVIYLVFFSLSASCQEKNVKTEYYYNSIKKSEGELINEKKNGQWKYWYENGVLLGVENYNNDTLNGLALSYYMNGQVQDSAVYKNWEPIGIVKSWYPNGKLSYLKTYDIDGSGNLNGKYLAFNKEGLAINEGIYLNGTKNGDWKVYYFDTGELKENQHYNKGVKVGEWVFFKKNGDTLRTEVYPPPLGYD